MKMSVTSKLLLALVAIVSCVSCTNSLFACGSYGADSFDLEEGVMRGDQWVNVDLKGSLVVRNLSSGAVRNYGSFGRKLLPYLDVQGDRACLMTKEEVCLISLKTGELLHAQTHTLGRCAVGMIDQHTVFLNNGSKIAVVDIRNGRMQREIDLIPRAKLSPLGAKHESLIQHVRHGDLLYVGRLQARGLAVVDMRRWEKVQEIRRGLGWPTRLQLAGGKLLVEHSFKAVGLPQELVSLVDLTQGAIETFASN